MINVKLCLHVFKHNSVWYILSLHLHSYTICNAVRVDVLLNYPLSQTQAM